MRYKLVLLSFPVMWVPFHNDHVVVKLLWVREVPNAIRWLKKSTTTTPHRSGVHVLLVSLLVNQLSGLFLIFFGRPKKICPVSDLFCSLSWIFCPVFFKKWEIDRTIGRPRDWPKPHFQKRLDKKFKRVNKKDLILDKFFFGRPKKMRNRPDNWSTKRLTKTTWTGLLNFFWSGSDFLVY